MPRIDRETLRPRLNLYEVLQISATASPDVIQAAYRALARAYHPDLNPSPNAARMMRQLNAAYNVLSDPERRSRYDAQRAPTWRTRSPAQAAVRPTPTPSPPPTPPKPTSASPTSTRPGVKRAVALPTAPVRTTWRVGRLLGLLLVLVLMMGALGLAFWWIVGVLEEEPLGPMRAAALYVGPHLTFLS
jgi:hypothetical protein